MRNVRRSDQPGICLRFAERTRVRDETGAGAGSRTCGTAPGGDDWPSERGWAGGGQPTSVEYGRNIAAKQRRRSTRQAVRHSVGPSRTTVASSSNGMTFDGNARRKAEPERQQKPAAVGCSSVNGMTSKSAAARPSALRRRPSGMVYCRPSETLASPEFVVPPAQECRASSSAGFGDESRALERRRQSRSNTVTVPTSSFQTPMKVTAGCGAGQHSSGVPLFHYSNVGLDKLVPITSCAVVERNITLGTCRMPPHDMAQPRSKRLPTTFAGVCFAKFERLPTPETGLGIRCRGCSDHRSSTPSRHDALRSVNATTVELEAPVSRRSTRLFKYVIGEVPSPGRGNGRVEITMARNFMAAPHRKPARTRSTSPAYRKAFGQ